MNIGEHVDKLLAIDECLALIDHLLERHRHHSNDHIQEQDQRHESAKEKDEPEEPRVICIANKGTRNGLKVSNCQRVRVKNRFDEAFDPVVTVDGLIRVLIEDVEQERLCYDHEEKHASNLSRTLDDFEELADEGLEELEDLQEAEELQVQDQNYSYHEAAEDAILFTIELILPNVDRFLLSEDHKPDHEYENYQFDQAIEGRKIVRQAKLADVQEHTIALVK